MSKVHDLKSGKYFNGSFMSASVIILRPLDIVHFLPKEFMFQKYRGVGF
jgi:hypothetical protein